MNSSAEWNTHPVTFLRLRKSSDGTGKQKGAIMVLSTWALAAIGAVGLGVIIFLITRKGGG